MIRTWHKVVAVAVGITAVYVAAGHLGAQLPRPAWAAELHVLKEYIVTVDAQGTRRAIESDQLQLLRNMERQDALRAKRLPISHALLLEQTILQGRLRENRERQKQLEAIK